MFRQGRPQPLGSLQHSNPERRDNPQRQGNLERQRSLERQAQSRVLRRPAPKVLLRPPLRVPRQLLRSLPKLPVACSEVIG
jgi:hypothetical protein